MKLLVRAILTSLITLTAVIPHALLPNVAQAQGEERRVSLRLYNEAAEDYRAGRYDDAADKLETAHRLYPEPILLYNLARALEGGGDLDGALDAYREFLEAADEDAEERTVTRARIEVIEGLLADIHGNNNGADNAADDDNTDDDDADDGYGQRVHIRNGTREDPPNYALPITLAVSAVVVAGIGIPLQLRAQSFSDEADGPMTSQRRASELNTQSRRNAVGGIVMLSAGGVLAVASVILFVVRKNQRTQVSLSPTGASVHVRF